MSFASAALASSPWHQLSWAAAALCNCPSSPSSLFWGGKVLIHPAHRCCSTALVASLWSGSTSGTEQGKVKRGRKVGAGGRSHCSTHVSTSPWEMLARKRQIWWMVAFSRECNAKQVVPGTYRPRAVSVLLSEVHLQQALILATMGCADKRHNGRGCGVNHPSARLQQSCAYCRIPALMYFCCPRWYWGRIPSCSAATPISPQCCGCSPHSVLACATEEVSYIWIPVPQWLIGALGLK